MPQRHSWRRPRIIMVVGALLAGALVVMAAWFSQPPASSQSVADTPVAVAASPTASPLPAPQVNTPLDTVPAQAEPTTLTIATLGFDRMSLDRMIAGPSGSTLNPPTYSDPHEVWRNFAPNWVSDLGVPGRAATDTVFILGHACAAGCQEVSWQRFNRLVDLKVGDPIVLGTAVGDIRYAVTGMVSYQNNTVTRDVQRRVWGRHPGELHLVSCSESVPGSGNFDQRTVIIATLSG